MWQYTNELTEKYKIYSSKDEHYLMNVVSECLFFVVLPHAIKITIAEHIKVSEIARRLK